jgi:flagellar hook protein FlgE
LEFTSSGAIDTADSKVSPFAFSLSDGAAPMNLTWDLNQSGDTLSQVNGDSNQSAQFTDGFAAGQFNGFEIDPSGNIVVSYTNQQTQIVGQLAIASVENEQGLVHTGADDYQTTEASGQATFGVAGTGGRGTIEGGALEGSNVDTSTEFADLIQAQRAFEANSKAVTTFDSITENVINMVSGQ